MDDTVNAKEVTTPLGRNHLLASVFALFILHRKVSTSGGRLPLSNCRFHFLALTLVLSPGLPLLREREHINNIVRISVAEKRNTVPVGSRWRCKDSMLGGGVDSVGEATEEIPDVDHKCIRDWRDLRGFDVSYVLGWK